MHDSTGPKAAIAHILVLRRLSHYLTGRKRLIAQTKIVSTLRNVVLVIHNNYSVHVVPSQAQKLVFYHKVQQRNSTASISRTLCIQNGRSMYHSS